MKKFFKPVLIFLVCGTVVSSCSSDNADEQPALEGKGVKSTTLQAVQFATEGLHSLALTASGEVYGTGELSYGEMGLGFQKDFEITYPGGVTNNFYAHNFKKLTDPLATNIKK